MYAELTCVHHDFVDLADLILIEIQDGLKESHGMVGFQVSGLQKDNRVRLRV